MMLAHTLPAPVPSSFAHRNTQISAYFLYTTRRVLKLFMMSDELHWLYTSNEILYNNVLEKDMLRTFTWKK